MDARRVANRYLRTAGILRPPPKLWAAIEEAGLRMLAEGWLGLAEQELAQSGPRARVLAKLKAKYEKRISGLLADMHGMSQGERSIKLPAHVLVSSVDKPIKPEKVVEGELRVELDWRGNWRLWVRAPRDRFDPVAFGLALHEVEAEVKNYQRFMADMFEEMHASYVEPRQYVELRNVARKYGARSPNLILGYEVAHIDVDLSGWEHAPTDPWSPSITVEMHQSERSNALGDWTAEDMRIRVWVGANLMLPMVDDGGPLDPWFRESDGVAAMTRVRRTLLHETVHAAQTILQETRGLPKPGGLPKWEAREPGYESNPNAWNEAGGWSLEHPRRDIEFHTRLTDEVGEFLEAWERALKDVGFYGKPVDRRSFFAEWVKTRQFFSANKGNTRKWRDAVGKLVAELERQGWDLGPRSKMWAPVVTPKHPAWGLSMARYFQNRGNELAPRREVGGQWQSYDEHRAEKAKVWPQIREEYERFVDGLEPDQLARHKQLVHQVGDTEYWVTPRWHRWDGTGEPPEKDGPTPDHPKLPRAYRSRS